MRVERRSRSARPSLWLEEAWRHLRTDPVDNPTSKALLSPASMQIHRQGFESAPPRREPMHTNHQARIYADHLDCSVRYKAVDLFAQRNIQFEMAQADPC